jgi:hypothetical protein
MSFALRVAALVLFIVAALVVWVTSKRLDDAVGLVAAGLACWVASTFPFPPVTA